MRDAPASPRYRDAHSHLSAGAADLLDLDLRGRDDGEIGDAIAAAARGTGLGSWIRGWGWSGAGLPRDAAPDRPTWIARRDGHAAWINAAARAVLGVDPAVSVVAEDLFEAMRAKLPERTTSERRSAVVPRLHELRDLGIVSIDDMVEPWGPELYAQLHERRELPISVGIWLPESMEPADAEACRGHAPFSPKHNSLWGETGACLLNGIKIFLDGSLSARTAALSFPYADDPGNFGALRIEESALRDRIGRWAHRGWPVAIHAIGDRAVSLALAALESVPRPAWAAHRIEHAQVVRRSDLPRFARAGVIASVQPGHWRDDRGWMRARVGGRVDVVLHPLRSLTRAGAELVLGSDWPVSSWEPASILAAASDPGRGEEALDAASAAAWYTLRPS